MARNRSVAKASDALLSARIIPVVLLVVFLFLTCDPLIQGSLLALPVQVVISAGIGMMVMGYLLIRSIVRRRHDTHLFDWYCHGRLVGLDLG